MLDERDRIAADLHDHIVQRLYATGLSLRSIATGLGSSPATDRVLATVADLDAIIGQIRTTIFQLHGLAHTGPDSLRVQLLTVADASGKHSASNPLCASQEASIPCAPASAMTSSTWCERR